MYRALATGPIGVKASFDEAARLAADHGFQGLAVSMAEINEFGLDHVRRTLDQRKLIPALTGIPVNFRDDDAAFEQDMAKLPVFARTMADLGCIRVATWLKPWHETFSYEANFAQLRARTAQICEVLGQYGLRYGLEYVGPKTMRAGKPNPFIYDQAGLFKLFQAVGAPNLGILLDAFHWYTSGGDLKELDQLTDALVVVVHVNDAAAGAARDEQIDNVRAMPGETGVIDIAAFMRALDRMAYTGPVMVEPFCAWVRALPAEEAVAATSRSLDKIWAVAGL